MKTWLLGGVIGALAGASLYLTLAQRSSPPPAVAVESVAPQAAATASPTPPAPLVLPRVVDVTDIDPLLDPPAIPAAEPATPAGPTITRVGYEEAAPMPVVPAADVKPIPPAATDDHEGAGRVAPAELALLIGLLVADESEPQLASPPREVLPAWERGFQPVPGPVMLDQAAARARYPESPVTQHNTLFFGSSNFGPPLYLSDESLRRLTAATPLGPLFALSDADLLKPPPVVVELPGGTGGRWVWVPDPPAPQPMDAVRRTYGVFHTANQAPASRVEWYARWYGGAQFPKQMGSVLTTEQVLIATERVRSKRVYPHFITPFPDHD